MKRTVSLVLTLCLFLVLNGTAFADFYVTSSQLWIDDGQGLDYDRCFYPLDSDVSGKGWNWNGASMTLTLDNFQGSFFFETLKVL